MQNKLEQFTSASPGIFPPAQQVIVYNAFDKVASITEGDKSLQITYGHHRQRIAQQYTDGSNTTHKRWVGACEYITENGQQRILTYLSGPEGVFALHKKPRAYYSQTLSSAAICSRAMHTS